MRSQYRIKVDLQNVDPPIWRRLLVPGDFRLHQLHQAIQIAMGWRGYHLHEMYHKASRRFFMPRFALDEISQGNAFDERAYSLDEVCPRPKDTLLYTYDLGDNWQHLITVEKVDKAQDGQPLPRCLEGQSACPPEDSGGVHQFSDLLEILADPEHEDHEEMVRWCGDSYDPEVFEVDEVNQELARQHWSRWHFIDLAGLPVWEWPDEVVDEILATLRAPSPDHDELLTALRCGGHLEVLNETIVQEISRFLDPEVGGLEATLNAVLALGPLLEMMCEDPDSLLIKEIRPETVANLRSTLSDMVRDETLEEQLRQMALEVAVRYPEPWMTDMVRLAADSKSPTWRQTAYFCMGYLQGFEDEVRAALETRSPDVLLQAVEAAGVMMEPDLARLLRQLALDPGADTEVRTACLESLEGIDPMLLEDTLELLVERKDEAMLEVATEFLADLG